MLTRNWRGYPWKFRFGKDSFGKRKLNISIPAKMGCIVAARYVHQDIVDNIILGSGPSAQGAGWDQSEARANKNYLIQIGVPENSILVRESALNTYRELDDDLDLAKQKGFTRLALMTISTQILRSKRYLEKRGFSLDFIETETEYARNSNLRQALVDKYHHSIDYRYEIQKEKVLRGFQSLGITSSLGMFLALIVRGRCKRS